MEDNKKRGPCAACRHNRNNCGPNCRLAPYFTANQDFLNACKLFGYGNILKWLDEAPDECKDDVIKSVIYEANARAKDPVGGSRHIVLCLKSMLRNSVAKLELINRQLQMVRSTPAMNSTNNPIAGQELVTGVQQGHPNAGGEITTRNNVQDHVIMSVQNHQKNHQFSTGVEMQKDGHGNVLRDLDEILAVLEIGE